jgi:DNA-binding transcriptional ArsR family regulator
MTAAPASHSVASEPFDTSDPWWATWCDLMPRELIRVDWRRDHSYKSAKLSMIRISEAIFPYAVYLADPEGCYRLLCFDLDSGRGDVEDGCQRLRELLDAVGVAYVVATSGPGGGRHIWSSWPEGLTAEKVHDLATVLAREISALDIGCLRNPKTGCVRPIGAPHRHGGKSELLPEWPTGDAIALLRRGNPPQRFGALMDALTADTPAKQRTVEDGRHGDMRDGRRRHLLIEENEQPRLAGTRRELSSETRELLYAPIPAGADAHPITWRCLLRLVFARYSADDVAKLLHDPAVRGLEHLRSSRDLGGNRRSPRSPEMMSAILARQWSKAVDTAVGMFRGVPGDPDDGLVELISGVQAMADSVTPGRWAGQAGPADRLVLDAICVLVLDHGRAQVGASVRRVAELAGIGTATASRALGRLSQPDSDGYTWLIQITAASGRDAAVWQLAEPSDCNAASIRMRALCAGGTQGNPPPKVSPAALRALLEHNRSDVWTPRGGGLGHHAARTHAAILQGVLGVEELSRRTGYTVRIVRAHLNRLQKAGLVDLSNGDMRTTNHSLAYVAADLGVDSVGLARRLRHQTEREAYAWWNDELQWRREKGKRRFPRSHRTFGAASTPIDEKSQAYEVRRRRYGRFPVRTGGRGDFAAALRIVRDHDSRANPSAQNTNRC